MLTPGEITVGMFITVLKWHNLYDNIEVSPDNPMANAIDIMKRQTVNHNSCGIPYQVKAIDLPYVIGYDHARKANMVFDIRLCDLKELNKEFIAACGMESLWVDATVVNPEIVEKAKAAKAKNKEKVG